ncbi:pyruvate dehydrogenase E2 component (dihydrolipoamide acetyltransferase) [Rhodococcus wratislaviensis]|uniref:Dihydrolipoamide acetyltransferase component of pyruvate dehydrogenase complex n=1 Tax=Rhodococcus wratislaviensis TaxID=44752 RepID=A0AB38FDM9_RHOWR|nr:dihydrolipoamide acetyltransferase family protein [Rhodococcus wratislaviensis]REE75519.1 pyruvate dehydrogenase E2 component (dihydrolipoamide acetyltransferase) [Rhodococcus wratislaviensis]SPZ39445.1 branched-chain alpha-keto acid dehydrogenase subunit E2 [Rhodococcus wratislaviensis]
MSDQVFLLPDLGEGLTEADIAEWKVRVGDTVTIDQVVVEVETAKAAVEVPIPFEGTVISLHGDEGSTLQVGTPLITVSGTPAAHEQYREEERAGSGNVLIGYGTSEDTRVRRRRVRRPDVTPSPRSTGGVRVISPVIRNLARQNGLDLSGLSGSGPGGVINRADVERALTTPPETADAQRIPIKGLRKAVADKLSTSRREIPDATTWVDVDATDLLAARRAINAALDADAGVSLMALLGRLALAALKQYPELNSTVDTARNEIVRYGHVHLGIAAQTPRGLVVPVIENADTLTTVELARQLQETTALAREGTLPPARLTGGTFTLNNYGVFGVDGSTPIINHPEAAILGVGRIIDKPWVVHGQLAVRKVTQVSLSFDHRVCDGGVAGGFLRLFADYIENPITVLGRL